MKTYSVAIQGKNGIWVTNIGQFNTIDEIDWDAVKKLCIKNGDLAYGYYYGHKSNTLTSPQCRTVMEVIEPCSIQTYAIRLLGRELKDSELGTIRPKLSQLEKDGLLTAFAEHGNPIAEKKLVFSLSLDQRLCTPKDAVIVLVMGLELGYLTLLDSGELSLNSDQERMEIIAREHHYEDNHKAHEEYLINEQAIEEDIESIACQINLEVFEEIEEARLDIMADHATYCLDNPPEDCKKHGNMLEELPEGNL